MNLNAPELALALLCVIGTAWTAYGVYALVSVWQEVRTDLRQELGSHFGLARFAVFPSRWPSPASRKTFFKNLSKLG